MRNITIKGIPGPLYRRLKKRAAQHRRSLNNEVIVCLEQSVPPTRVDPKSYLARLDALHKRLKRLNLPPLTDKFLQEAKNRGRA